ncbi:MAG: T3SS effector HopA1 family protein [Thermoleophilia bacterium]
MSTAGRQLRMAAGAVDIRGPGSYVWRGEAINGPRDADVRGDGLVANLVQRLYERFYLTGARLHAPDVHARPQPWLCELPVTIARALREQRRLDRGWRPVGDENGQLVLERDGIRVWADPDEVVRGDDGICALRTAVDLPMRSFGFHTVLGVAGAPAMTGPRDRWYWHLRPDAAVAFVTDVCERLNAVDAAFHLKVLADPDIYGRADGGVLTTARADREVVVRAAALLLRRFGAMHPVVPALSTLRLAPGLGFAEDPDDGRSFGATRCALVAGGLWDGFLAGAAGADERLEAVRARLALAGLDPDRPHLGPGGGDDPLLPAPHPKRRGARVTVEFPDVAAHIGRRLVDEARWDGGRCTWIAPHPDARERSGFVTRDLEPSWHAGTAGVAWFLAELWRAQGDAALRRTAQGAMRQSVAGCRDIPVADRGGLFAGWAGIAVAAAAVGRLTGAPEDLETAAHLAEEFGAAGG